MVLIKIEVDAGIGLTFYRSVLFCETARYLPARY
jgi:hypothetical protein